MKKKGKKIIQYVYTNDEIGVLLRMLEAEETYELAIEMIIAEKVKTFNKRALRSLFDRLDEVLVKLSSMSNRKDGVLKNELRRKVHIIKNQYRVVGVNGRKSKLIRHGNRLFRGV